MDKDSIACVVKKQYMSKVRDQLTRLHLKVDKEEEATDFSNIIYYIRKDYVTFLLKQYPFGYDPLNKDILKEELRELQETYCF